MEFTEQFESLQKINTVYELEGFREQLAKYEAELEEVKLKTERG